MNNHDLLQRFIFANAPVRGEYIHLQSTFHEIVHQHDYPPAIKQLLGEALCVAGLLSAIIKFDGRLTVQFRGKGKLKMLLAQCDNQFHMRGLAKYEGEMSYDDLMEAFNDGVLVIMLDSGLGGKNRYQGIVSWRGNSLVESIEGYFRESEQLATKIWLAVSDGAAAGYLLQVVPGKDKAVSAIEKEIIAPSWEHLTKLTTSNLQPADMFQVEYPQLLSKLYPEEEIRIFEGVPVKFQCTCSRQRGADAIELLGKKEAEAELKNNNSIVVTCDFCNREYVFDRVDIANIFENKDRPPPNTQIH